MKILITTDLYTVTTNGVVTSVRNLKEELQKKGHDVRILTFSDNMSSYKDGEVYYIKSLPIGFIYPDVRMPISYYSRHIRELVEWKPDVIHSQCEFFSYQYAKRISKLTGAPMVHTYHTLYEQYASYIVPSKRLGNYIVRNFSRMRLKNAEVIIAPTGKVENALRSYGVENKIRVVPSGISLKQHGKTLTDAEKEERRAQLGIPKDHQVLLNLGRLGTEKNLDELVDYFAQALSDNEKLTFLIVGDGPAKEGLEKQVAKLGIGKNVIFTGMVPPTEVQDYYQLADVFVSASTSETQGLTYIEAAANGLPLLCRQDDCLDGVIEEGVNGYEYSTMEEFLDELERVTADEEWCADAGEKSKEIAQTFDKEHFVDTMEIIYEKIVGESL